MMFDLRRILGATLLTAVAFLSSVAAAAPTAGRLLAEGRLDDEILLLQSRINSAPHDAESYSILCRAYFMLGEWDPGIAACEKAASLDPDK
jgi:protein involved in temperature-dependent protein secretion